MPIYRVIYKRSVQSSWSSHGNSDKSDTSGSSKVVIVGSSVNIPEMTASLQAKVSVSEEKQQDPSHLAAVYDLMAAKFVKSGFNLKAIEEMRRYFYIPANPSGPGERCFAEPLPYDRFSAPLPPAAVRLTLIFYQRENSALATLVNRAAQDIVSRLPLSTVVHVNDPSHYHVTVYMTSQPHNLRPDPFDPSAVLPPLLTPHEIWKQAAPSEEVLQKELHVLREETLKTKEVGAPRLKVHRLVMADSGTLLLCFTDSTGSIGKLRKRLKDAFPGGPERQSTILHSSIARVLSPSQLSPEEISTVQVACDIWTEKVKGMEIEVDSLYHVYEEQFTTVIGPAERLPFSTFA